MEDRLGELQGRLHGMTGEEYQSRSTVAGRGRRGILWRSLCLNRRTTGSSRMASQATLLTCQYNVRLHFQILNLFSSPEPEDIETTGTTIVTLKSSPVILESAARKDYPYVSHMRMHTPKDTEDL